MIRFYGEELLALRPTPILEDHPLSASAPAYSIYSQLPHILEAVPPSATPCNGDRDPLITGILRLCTNFRYTRMTSVFLWVLPKQAFSYDAPFSVKIIHYAYFSKWGGGGGGSGGFFSLDLCMCVREV
jgi:hypothetical protein